MSSLQRIADLSQEARIWRTNQDYGQRKGEDVGRDGQEKMERYSWGLCQPETVGTVS